MQQRRSPNFSRRGEAPVSILVLHYTGMKSADEALARLCLADAKVSAHYLVDEEGRITQLVDEESCAWHAGLSFWRGVRNVNPVSIGIEIANPGHEWGYRPFPQAQMEAVAKLSQGILSRHAIAARDVVAHSDVAPDRKEDPGELFDWQWLARQGVGLWPEDSGEGRGARGETGDIQRSLAAYGYDVAQTGLFDAPTRKVVTAFQRHFRPRPLGGEWDAECAALLAALLAQAGR